MIAKSEEKAKEEILARGDSEGGRAELLLELAALERRNEALDAELKKFENCDPQLLHRLEADSLIAKASANRWTDNCFLLLQWIQHQKPGVTQAELETNFSILKNLDTID